MLPPLDPAISGDARALAALARTRALGLHFLGHFLSVCAVENGDGHSQLRLVPPEEPSSGDGRAGSATELSILADLTCGSAIRSVLRPGIRLGTTHLTLAHLLEPEPGPLDSTARVLWFDAEAMEGHARCEIRDTHGRIVATATGWFIALPAPAGQDLPPVPWEAPPGAVRDLGEADLDPHERLTLAAMREATARAQSRGSSPVEALVSPPAPPGPAEQISYSLANTPALGNRVRQMQGGALYGAAAAATSAALGPGWRIAGGAVQFLRPVDAPEVEVSARVLRRGRRVAFTEAEVRGAGRSAIAARFTHRPLP